MAVLSRQWFLFWTLIATILLVVSLFAMLVAAFNIGALCADDNLIKASHGQYQHNCTIISMARQENDTIVTFGETVRQYAPICLTTWSQVVSAEFAAALGPTAAGWSAHDIACESPAISLIRNLPLRPDCNKTRNMTIGWACAAALPFSAWMALSICYCIERFQGYDRLA